MSKGKIKHQTGADCVIAWWEPGREDGADSRKVKASAVRYVPKIGGEYWDVAVSLDGERVGSMCLFKEGRVYAVDVCRALVLAIGRQAGHRRRNLRNRKARKVEREAVIAETVARMNGEEA